MRSLRVILLTGVSIMAISGAALAQSAPLADPPGRVGRLAYMQGTVSFHDVRQDTWSPAAVNTPLTSGDALWTEPNGHDEISLAGTRVRMDGDTQLDMLAIDDSQVRMQLDQGRLDIKTFAFDNTQPYQVVTPRGTVTLEQQGDYYIHAGSADDPTLLGVRSGAAQIQTPNGQVLAVRAGEVGEVTGSGDSLQLVTVRSAPPAVAAYWAQRDQQITYAQPQYLTADVTGYEDLAYYGGWTADPDYGEVWYPNSVPAGWQPYSTGYWSYVGPWGWTWVDAQPWGFAPYHYGRWARRGDRWCWVPPERADRPVYAPALVAFVGGTELGVAIGLQSRAPVGWFPLGPREPYVPPYATDPAYYRRVNAGDRVQQAMLDDRWQRAERHEALRADEHNEALMNRRFATVVSAEDFARSRPVQQAALKVAADKLASAPVAPVAAPPAPNRSVAAAEARGAEAGAHGPAQGGLPTAQTRLANMEEIGRPAPGAQRGTAPGPRIAAHANEPNAKPGLPPLAPHAGAAPPRLEGERTPAAQRPGQLPPVPQANRTEPPHANEPARPEGPRPEAQHPEPPHPAVGPQRSEQRAEPQHVEPQHVEPPHAAPHPAVEPQHPAPPPRAEPQHPTEAVRPQPPHMAPPQQETHAPPPAPHPSAPPPPPHMAPQQEAHAPPPAPHASAPPPPPPHPAAPAPAPHPAPQNHEEKK